MLRRLVALPLPPGPAVLAALPALADALAGRGPALLPVPADEDGAAAEAARRVSAARLDAPLAADEDDPADPTAVVVSTSGATGTPKGALLAVSALTASIAATAERLGGAGRWLLALPAHHIAGLQVLLRSITAGTEPVVLDRFSLEGFTRATAELGSGRRYTSLVPTQLVRLLDGGPETLLAYDAVLVGGAATPSALQDRARAAGVRLMTTYGMSETCGGCVYDGVPLESVRVRIDEGSRVHLGGPVVARGYRGRPDLSATAFRGDEFRTDDRGQLADGRLVVLGRVDDALVTGGLKVEPTAVEELLAAMPQVREALVVGVPDAEWGQLVTALVVPRSPSSPPSLSAVRAAVAAALPPAAVPRRLLIVDALPLRGPGKPDRAAAARLAGQA